MCLYLQVAASGLVHGLPGEARLQSENKLAKLRRHENFNKEACFENVGVLVKQDQVNNANSAIIFLVHH